MSSHPSPICPPPLQAEAAALNAAGNAAYNSKQYARAAELYGEAAAADRSTAKYNTNLANDLRILGKLQEALQAAEAAIAADSTWTKGYYFKAVVLEALERIPEALAACDAGLKVEGEGGGLPGAAPAAAAGAYSVSDDG